jgi:hypothetical protein
MLNYLANIEEYFCIAKFISNYLLLFLAFTLNLTKITPLRMVITLTFTLTS